MFSLKKDGFLELFIPVAALGLLVIFITTLKIIFWKNVLLYFVILYSYYAFYIWKDNKMEKINVLEKIELSTIVIPLYLKEYILKYTVEIAWLGVFSVVLLILLIGSYMYSKNTNKNKIAKKYILILLVYFIYIFLIRN